MMNTHLCRGRFVSGEFNLWAVVVLLGCKLGKNERKKERDQKKKKIAEAKRASCGSIQRLSLPEKMPGLQQPGGPPVPFKSATSNGYPSAVSLDFSDLSLDF